MTMTYVMNDVHDDDDDDVSSASPMSTRAAGLGLQVRSGRRLPDRVSAPHTAAAMADGGVKRNIPIKHMGDFSVLDSEFSNIRERFDNEMRKMEDEMTRFRSELMNHESNFFKTSTR
ncbi:hypothetical protein ONE63_009235 [Megalurothrips usitatus]|uniref:Uncharacterized protein n=1 Tax=Megalurothrips usitatus TaxID=439358 RepID=A0AAV7XN55_9NEOP|nr:hypothetical protein ONE63_009235 [Megalurothrips usitatus]